MNVTNPCNTEYQQKERVVLVRQTALPLQYEHSWLKNIGTRTIWQTSHLFHDSPSTLLLKEDREELLWRASNPTDYPQVQKHKSNTTE